VAIDFWQALRQGGRGHVLRAILRGVPGAGGRGLHSFTLELNLSNSRTHS